MAQLVLISAPLFASLAAVAQEATSAQSKEPPTALAQPELFKTEATKAQDIQNTPTQNTQTTQAVEDQSKTIAGVASYYAAKFHGKRTASGEKFNSKLLTAAHQTLPFGTLLKVRNLRNMKSVIVRVNDRGPHVRGRIVDVSRAAAELIGITHTGVARVELEILSLKN